MAYGVAWQLDARHGRVCGRVRVARGEESAALPMLCSALWKLAEHTELASRLPEDIMSTQDLTIHRTRSQRCSVTNGI